MNSACSQTQIWSHNLPYAPLSTAPWVTTKPCPGGPQAPARPGPCICSRHFGLLCSSSVLPSPHSYLFPSFQLTRPQGSLPDSSAQVHSLRYLPSVIPLPVQVSVWNCTFIRVVIWFMSVCHARLQALVLLILYPPCLVKSLAVIPAQKIYFYGDGGYLEPQI